MGPLKNPLHEKFVQALASGKFQSNGHAYQSVRPRVSIKTAGVKACLILGTPAAKARLEELTGVWKEKAKLDELAAQRTIELAAERMAEKVVLSREWVLDQLIENVTRAMQAVAITDSDGAPTGEYRYDGNVANRALELLGKELGMFVDRSVNLNVTYGISDEPMTAEQWAAKHGEPAQIN